MPVNRYYILEKEGLKGFLKAAAQEYTLVCPQEAENGDFLLQEAGDAEKISLDYDITSNTLKGFFFPRRETIFNYETARGSIKIRPAANKAGEPAIFFGVRSCDIRAVYFQDLFFARPPKDTLYFGKRDKSILISIACPGPLRKSCFCAYTGSGPILEEQEGFDLQLMDSGKDFLVEAGSIKGASLIGRYKRFFTAAGPDAWARKASLKKEYVRGFGRRYDLLKVYNKLKNKDLSGLWKELGARCANCAGCEFICPTCFCYFNQEIKSSAKSGERIRAWDSCTFTGYSRMAGDVTPHEKNSERISRRFFCKLYNAYKWFGVFACTGCGRCAFVCPVNLDMPSFISSLARGNKYEPLLTEL